MHPLGASRQRRPGTTPAPPNKVDSGAARLPWRWTRAAGWG